MTETGDIKMEKAQPADLNEILALEKQCFFSDAFFRHQFYYFIHKSKSEFVVVRNPHKIIAYLIIQIRKNSRKYRIYSLAIAPEARGTGIGEKLLEYAERLARKNNIQKITLEVSEKNVAAIHLYKKMGFQIEKTRAGYYADGSPAWIMVKEVL
ncbi:MAG TPA: ribosomal protein S18-alanine N-acetyltransferase [Bacteroidales bacterium]|nr:ribosomal protein S18-alanine N-acetyltransferase [Bacteroidales bacterium]